MNLATAAKEGTLSPMGKMDAYMRILAWESYIARRKDMSRLERYRRSFDYYNGDNMPEGSLAMPLAINYLKIICESHAAYLWGQWESSGRMINWTVRSRSTKGDKEIMERINDWLFTLFDGYDEILYTAGMNQAIFGDCILLPRWDNLVEQVYPESILPEYFHCRWSPHDITRLQEVVISYPIARDDAEAEFQTRGDTSKAIESSYVHEYAIYWEWWNQDSFECYVDNVCVRSEPNPYSSRTATGLTLPGFIPFIHIPNVRAGGEFYGSSDMDGVYDLQDELNRRIADNSDIISYSAHPIVLVRKYFGRVRDLKAGPDEVWDMGREGEAEYLQGGKPPVDIGQYLDRVRLILQDLSYLPDTAYGHSDTAERSAISLAMKMMPTTNRVAWKRLHWRTGLVNYAHMAARLAEKHGALPFPRDYLRKVVIEPDFCPVLPKDRSAEIQDNVSLVTNGVRSTQRALEVLGERHVAEEVAEIYRDLAKKAELGMKLNLGGANGRGPGGSPDTGAEARDRGK